MVRLARMFKLIDKVSERTSTMMHIDTIMTTDLITILPTESLETARTLMHDNEIHHLPVTEEDNKLVGLVTLTNVLAATDSILRDPDNRLHARDINISDIMVTDVATVDEHASMRQAAMFLEKHRIGCLPVTQAGKLQGIITDTDFVGVAINLLEQIEETDFDD